MRHTIIVIMELPDGKIQGYLFVKNFLCVLFSIVHFIIVSLLLFTAGSTDYYIKRYQLYPNIAYVITGLLITLLVCLVILKCGKAFSVWFIKHNKTVIITTLSLFFILSVFICVSGFFYSDWDPLAILNAVHDILKGQPDKVGTAYFSNHPNNLLLVWIYLTVMRMTGLFGINSVLVLVVFQCLIATVSAFIFWRVSYDIFKDDPLISYIGLLIFEVWIVLSPWFIITYSDEAGIAFPLLILRIYQRMTRQEIKDFTGWALMSVVSIFGYFIKPQIVIAYIACMLFYVFRNLNEDKKRKLMCVVCSVSTIAVTAIFVKGIIIPSMGIKLDGDRSFGMAHYFMMGLNDETDGVYSDDDTLYTDSFNSPAEKRKADMAVAYERIKNYGLTGLLEHAKKKTLVNYNDGLFAWGVDGKFFAGRESEDLGDVPEMATTGLLWSFIMPEGSNHGKYSSFLQMIWLTVLSMSFICAVIITVSLFSKESDTSPGKYSLIGNNEIYVVMLAIIGLSLFEILFEAKARYLFIYTPYYLLLAISVFYFIAKFHQEKNIRDSS